MSPVTSENARDLLNACIRCIREEIIPLTREGVEAGSKVFGAAVLRQADLSTTIAATNNELENPMWHGEVHCIKRFYELSPDKRGNPKDSLFLCTHEPCSLCLSAITWSGFPYFTYLFTYEDSRDLFAIPHDIRILEEVYRVPLPGDTPEALAARPLYNKTNAFFTSQSMEDMIAMFAQGKEAEEWRQQLSDLKREYTQLSEVYQSNKGKADIAFA